MVLLITIMIFHLIVPIYTKQVYYPKYPLPHAIVFEGPTNYDSDNQSTNEVDGEFDLDVRFGREDNCPPGFYKQGDVCFPNDK